MGQTLEGLGFDDPEGKPQPVRMALLARAIDRSEDTRAFSIEEVHEYGTVRGIRDPAMEDLIADARIAWWALFDEEREEDEGFWEDFLAGFPEMRIED